MNLDILKKLLSRLNKYAFESFALALVNETGLPFFPATEAGQGVYYRELSLSKGTSFHSVLVTHFLPIDLFKEPAKVDIADPFLVERLRNIQRIYNGKTSPLGLLEPLLVEEDQLQSLSFLTNLANIEREVYEKDLIPKYERLIREVGIEAAGRINSFDTLFEFNSDKMEEAFKHFMLKNKDGLSLSLDDPEQACIESFTFERNLSRGVLQGSKSPCEPVFISSSGKDDILAEFESLIRKESKEAELEGFLVAHYKDVFGFEYDRIETQLWLKFPQLDIAGKNRRLDIFLRNSIENDWEIIEIKRVIELTSTYRDIPVLTHEITFAIQQIKNYASILSQESVRRKLARAGIEYYYPSLRLVVGKRPQIGHEQWRWLKSSNEKDVKITTFDELLDEMRLRLNQRNKLAEQQI